MAETGCKCWSSSSLLTVSRKIPLQKGKCTYQVKIRGIFRSNFYFSFNVGVIKSWFVVDNEKIYPAINDSGPSPFDQYVSISWVKRLKCDLYSSIYVPVQLTFVIIGGLGLAVSVVTCATSVFTPSLFGVNPSTESSYGVAGSKMETITQIILLGDWDKDYLKL